MPAALLDTALNFLGLRNIPDRGAKGAETRLTSANDARKLLAECLKEDGPRALERALVKGCVDGNPPYDDARRKAEGRGWEANLNFGKAKGVMKRTGAPYFNLFARVQCFVECNTAYQPDHPDHDQWNAAIASRLDQLLRRWDEFSWAVQQISYWMRLHGIGFAFFDKDHDWRFRPIETGNVLVPKDTPSVLGARTPYVFIRVPYRVHELWERIRDEESAKAAGWNIPAARNAIKFGMKSMMGTPGTNDWYHRPWEEYQRILSNGDLAASFTDGDVIHCAVMLLKEYSGKISKFIFTEAEVVANENPNASTTEATQANSQFIFADPNCYKRYHEAIVPFFRNNGDNDGEWHGVRGYAQESFKHVESENRLLCQGLNRAFINSSVALKFANERARTAAQLQVRGTIITIPAGAEWQQLFVQGGVEDLMLMQRLLGNHLDNNIGIGAPRGISREDGRGEVPTARHVDYVATNEGSISEAEITSYYGQSDAVYTVIFNRAADPSNSDEEAVRFRKECEVDGVPKEALAQMEYVRASRQNGYGSPEMAQIKFSQSKDVVPMLPEDGKQKWLENYITSIHGPQAAKEFAPRLHAPNNDDWMASVENEGFRSGTVPPLTSGQNDVIHCTSHIADAKQFLAPFAEAADPTAQVRISPSELQPAIIYVQGMAPNLQNHIARLQQDPTRRKEAQLFNSEFQDLIAFSGKLFNAYRRAQRQQRIEAEQARSATALSALDQAKVDSVRTQTALAAAKTQSSIENSRAKTVQSMAQKEAKTRQDLRIDARKAAIEIPTEVLSK